MVDWNRDDIFQHQVRNAIWFLLNEAAVTKTHAPTIKVNRCCHYRIEHPLIMMNGKEGAQVRVRHSWLTKDDDNSPLTVHDPNSNYKSRRFTNFHASSWESSGERKIHGIYCQTKHAHISLTPRKLITIVAWAGPWDGLIIDCAQFSIDLCCNIWSAAGKREREY